MFTWSSQRYFEDTNYMDVYIYKFAKRITFYPCNLQLIAHTKQGIELCEK